MDVYNKILGVTSIVILKWAESVLGWKFSSLCALTQSPQIIIIQNTLLTSQSSSLTTTTIKIGKLQKSITQINIT